MLASTSQTEKINGADSGVGHSTARGPPPCSLAQNRIAHINACSKKSIGDIDPGTKASERDPGSQAAHPAKHMCWQVKIKIYQINSAFAIAMSDLPSSGWGRSTPHRYVLNIFRLLFKVHVCARCVWRAYSLSLIHI